MSVTFSGGITFTGGGFSFSAGPTPKKAIFGYGYSSGGMVSTTNLVSDTGVVATNTTGIGTARYNLAAAGYGTDKAIFGYGNPDNATYTTSVINLVSNTGVVSTDTAGVGTARQQIAAAGYGTDKAIFGYGYSTVNVSMTNLVSNTGVVASDTTGVGTARRNLAAAGYGTDKAIFGYGYDSTPPYGTNVSLTNLVSNTGQVVSEVTGVGTARAGLTATGYGTDTAIFGYGDSSGGSQSVTNLVSNTGVVSTDTTGVGTARWGLAAARYGSSGQAIFGYGYSGAPSYLYLSMTNLVSNTGVVSTDTAGVGTARYGLAAAVYG